MLRLAQSSKPRATYAADVAKSEVLPDISFDTDAPAKEVTPPESLNVNLIAPIKERNGVYFVEGREYATMDNAKLAWEGANERAMLAKM